MQEEIFSAYSAFQQNLKQEAAVNILASMDRNDRHASGRRMTKKGMTAFLTDELKTKGLKRPNKLARVHLRQAAHSLTATFSMPTNTGRTEDFSVSFR